MHSTHKFKLFSVNVNVSFKSKLRTQALKNVMNTSPGVFTGQDSKTSSPASATISLISSPTNFE